MNDTKPGLRAALAVTALAACVGSPVGAQTGPAAPGAPPAAAPAPAAAASPLDALSWLRGCWKGSVNRREFREQWSPPRGGMMVGISHTVVAPKIRGTLNQKLEAVGKELNPATEKTQDFEYLRLEARADGVYYVDVPSGKKELAFKLTDVGEDRGHKVFTFTNTVDEFPQRIVYRHATEGWLYAQVMAKPGSHTNDVTYPMQHVDCLTDALLPQ
jgi:uncharacterized protein DUF6265